MRKHKIKYNVDRVKICFQQNQNALYERLYNSKTNLINIGDNDNISLYILRETEEEQNKITANVILHEEGDFLFGHLVLTNSKKYNSLCWLSLTNEALYKEYTAEGAYSFVYYLNSIAYNLNLFFNNITEIEVCADTTSNIERKLRRLIKDHENYEMILNGKKISDPHRKIENYFEAFSRSRAKLINSPTLYFEQAKPNAPMLRVYNKSVEISDNGNKKDYIAVWNNFGNKPIHRAEVRLKNESIKQAWEKFINQFNLPDDEPMKQPSGIILCLDDENFLAWLWREYTNRIISFNTKQDEKITLHDLATA